MFLRAFISVAITLCTAVVSVSAQATQPRAVVQLKATLSGHTGRILELAFSPAGEMVATGSEDGTVRIWNTHTGEPKATLISAPKFRWGLGMVWSPDGRAIAIAGWGGDARVQVWDVRTVKMKAELPTRNTSKMIWSPDSKLFLTTRFDDGVAKVWDGETGSQLAALEQIPPCPKRSLWNSSSNDPACDTYKILTAYFDAAGQSVITASSGHPAKLWDARTGRLKTVLPLTGEGLLEKYYQGDVVMSPNHRLVARYLHGEVTLLDASTGVVKRELGTIGLPMAFSPDSQMLLTTIREPTTANWGKWDEFKLYDVATGKMRLTFERSYLIVFRDELHWNPQGRTILLGRGGAQLLDAHTGKVKANVEYGPCVSDRLIGDSGCQPFILSADGSIAAKITNPIRLWSAETGTLLVTLGKEQAHAPALFSPTDSRLLITRAKDAKTALLWEVLAN
jgi:WD40 repeat protein